MDGLPKGNTTLSSDPRKICAIYRRHPNNFYWHAVGVTCKRIEAYDENGQMASVPWVAIINDEDKIEARINAASLTEIVYSSEG